jgi:hypothetical protein
LNNSKPKFKKKRSIQKIELTPKLNKFVEELIQYGFEDYPDFVDIALPVRSLRLLNSIQHGRWSHFLEHLANGASPKHCSAGQVFPFDYAKELGNQDFIEALDFAIELWDRELLDEKGISHFPLMSVATS